jgi:hypothetical protein
MSYENIPKNAAETAVLIEDINPIKDYRTELALGNILGKSIMRALGERDNVQTTAAGEDIWRGNELSNVPAALASTTSIPVPSTSGEQMSVISENAADNSAGTGVQTLTVQYIDAAGDEQMTTVTMNGITAVPLTPSNVRFVQDLQALTVGSAGVAIGHIRIFKTSDATLVYSMIAAGGNQSLVPSKMVPLGKTLVLKKWVSSEASKSKRCRIRLRADCNNATPPIRQEGVFLFKSVTALDGSAVPMDLVYDVPELSVVKITAWAKVSGAEVGIHWWGELVDNS